ncbi:MAG: cupin domain-containing protein [Ignavibacteriales bacterium]|nr:cupin domain-containing protein [Ignavibacteriales bacterium]
MRKVVNIEKCFEKFNDTFSPKIVGTANDQNIMVARLEGDKVPWHTHDKEDEMFFVFDGVLDIFEKDKNVTLNSSEFYVVPKGVEHRVVPRGHVKLILIEPKDIAHTGNVKAEITKSSFEILDI